MDKGDFEAICMLPRASGIALPFFIEVKAEEGTLNVEYRLQISSSISDIIVHTRLARRHIRKSYDY